MSMPTPFTMTLITNLAMTLLGLPVGPAIWVRAAGVALPRPG